MSDFRVEWYIDTLNFDNVRIRSCLIGTLHLNLWARYHETNTVF